MPEAGEHGYSGRCVPKAGYKPWNPHETFSLGVFQWHRKAKGKGLKKGKVKVRVSGLTSKADAVEEKACEIAYQLDDGTYNGPKHVKVKGG